MAPGKPKSSAPASPALESAIKGFDELTLETEDPVVALIKLMQAKRLNATDLKSAKDSSKLNSFCAAEYSALAPLFGLSPSEGYEEFDKWPYRESPCHGMSSLTYSMLVENPYWLLGIPRAMTMSTLGIIF